MSEEACRCVGCQAEFTLTDRTVAWFLSRGLHVPKRCAACRAERRRLTATPPSEWTVEEWRKAEGRRAT